MAARQKLQARAVAGPPDPLPVIDVLVRVIHHPRANAHRRYDLKIIASIVCSRALWRARTVPESHIKRNVFYYCTYFRR